MILCNSFDLKHSCLNKCVGGCERTVDPEDVSNGQDGQKRVDEQLQGTERIFHRNMAPTVEGGAVWPSEDGAVRTKRSE